MKPKTTKRQPQQPTDNYENALNALFLLLLLLLLLCRIPQKQQPPVPHLPSAELLPSTPTSSPLPLPLPLSHSIASPSYRRECHFDVSLMAALLFRFYTRILVVYRQWQWLLLFFMWFFQFFLMRESAYGLQYTLCTQCAFIPTQVLKTQKKTRQTEILMARFVIRTQF